MENQEQPVQSPIQQISEQPESPLTNPINSEKFKPMSKTNVILGIVLLVTLGLLGLEAYFAFQPTPKQQPQPSSIQQIKISPTSLSTNTVQLPINPNASFIDFARIDYHFTTNIVDIKKNPDGSYEILTTLKDPSIPKLIVNSKSPIFFVNNEKKAPATYLDFRAGQKIGYSLRYGLRNKKIALLGIDIIQNTQNLIPSTTK